MDRKMKPYGIITGGRGSGRTTRSMLAAPESAHFFVKGNLNYYRYLAQRLGRGDLRIMSTDAFIDPHRFQGLRNFEVRLDHDCGPAMCWREWEGLMWLLEYANFMRGR